MAVEGGSESNRSSRSASPSCVIVDEEAERGRLLAEQITQTGAFVGMFAGDTPKARGSCLLVIEPSDALALREVITTYASHPSRNVVVALTPEQSRNATPYLEAGADDVVWLPVRVDEVVLRLSTWHKKRVAEEEAHRLRAMVEEKISGPIVGEAPVVRDMLSLLRRVARNDATVLILGETGTGKELVARTIHNESGRANKPFVALNLSAIPRDLVESELFGHVAGAFTGAKATREGRLEAAAGGTLFLDEVGDLPLSVQVKLLRVLQERSFERVGDNRPRTTDFRLLCATHRDLDQLVEAGEFREDLYYRLNVVQIHVPPLRERGRDVLLLAEHFMAQACERFGIRATLGPEGQEALRRHTWPGNVRELQHTIESCMALARDGDVIGPEVVRPRKKRGPTAALTTDILSGGRGLDEALAEIEKNVIINTLQRCEGNQRKAAELLKLPRQTLQNRMRKHGINEEE